MARGKISSNPRVQKNNRRGGRKCQQKASEGRTCPWNRGKKPAKTSQQHLFIPRDQLELFFAVGLYWAGPVYAAAIWVCLVTSRRIGEALALKGTDIRIEGGEDHDAPHVLYQRREGDKEYRGAGKLGADKVVARVSETNMPGFKFLAECGLQYECRELLEQYKAVHPALFEKRTLRREEFRLDLQSEGFIFPSKSNKKGCRPNMSRQTAWQALDRIREIMFELTGNRRWNPATKFRGQRVTLHGATRHTAASLLLFNKRRSEAAPSEHVVMEIQQRSDSRVFRKHYCHAEEEQVRSALRYGSPVLWGNEDSSHVEGGEVVSDPGLPCSPASGLKDGGEGQVEESSRGAKTHKYASRNARSSEVKIGASDTELRPSDKRRRRKPRGLELQNS